MKKTAKNNSPKVNPKKLDIKNFDLPVDIADNPKKGLLKNDEVYRKMDDNCMDFWLPLKTKVGGDSAKTFKNMLEQFDEVMFKKLEETEDYLSYLRLLVCPNAPNTPKYQNTNKRR